MTFTSRIQILKVDDPEVKPPRNGMDGYTVYSAQTALLDDAGNLTKVGRLPLPENLREIVKVGIYRASFALVVAGWGKTKGDVIAQLTGLIPEPVKPVPSLKGA